MHLFDTSEIRHHMDRYIRQRSDWLRGKVVVDLPAGEGQTARRIDGEVYRLGVDPRLMLEADLFVELEKGDGRPA